MRSSSCGLVLADCDSLFGILAYIIIFVRHSRKSGAFLSWLCVIRGLTVVQTIAKY